MALTECGGAVARPRPARPGLEVRWWLATALLALAVFAHVQDRVTAAAAVRFVAEQQLALDGIGLSRQADEAMRPAIARSAPVGLVAAAAVVGLSGVARLVALRLARRPS